MSYKHILVSIDLSEESHILIEKAISLAKAFQSKLSLIHVDFNYSEFYAGTTELNIDKVQKYLSAESLDLLKEFATSSPYPIEELLTAKGDLVSVLKETIKNYEIDLVVCGHHQDFWSKFISSARQVINSVRTDILIIPFCEPPAK